MTARIIDGKAIAAALRKKIADEVAGLTEKPGLAVVLVGDDPASQVYVRNKGMQTKEAGMRSIEHKLPADASEADLLALVRQLNADASVHGILVQLPLPKHISEEKVIQTVAPEKDVDGFHVINAGRLATGQQALVPCTPTGCVVLLKAVLGENLSGKHAVVIGRSNIVGKPMAALLLKENCTVTIIHSKTVKPAELCSQADIVVAAIGKPKMVTADWIKSGATVIDVGINRSDDGKLYGDVDFDSVAEVAGAITPVPGGVGPMTIACLLQNTLKAYKQQRA